MRGLVVAILFAFGMALGLFAGAAYLDRPTYVQHCEGHAHDATQGEDHVEDDGPKGWQYWGDISNRWQAVFALAFGIITAVFTYFLVQVSKSQRDLLKKANETAATAIDKATEANNAALEGLEQTKRSVDAYIEAERGAIVMYDALLNSNGTIEYGLENIGRSSVVILGIWSQPQAGPYLKKPGRLDTAFIRPQEAYLPLKSGGTAATAGLPRQVGSPEPRYILHPNPRAVTSSGMEDFRNMKAMIIFYGVVRYRTLQNITRRYWFTFFSIDGKNFAPIPGDAYNADIYEPFDPDPMPSDEDLRKMFTSIEPPVKKG